MPGCAVIGIACTGDDEPAREIVNICFACSGGVETGMEGCITLGNARLFCKVWRFGVKIAGRSGNGINEVIGIGRRIGIGQAYDPERVCPIIVVRLIRQVLAGDRGRFWIDGDR
ncbi:hypothetical protein SDC9_161312 [bioreactor metagenome]|uniref:Uncharacterized protein n=1 Tax=bioreactor metagenome TaxID=1076179 RepID=A0A645FK00_9ZZZZ